MGMNEEEEENRCSQISIKKLFVIWMGGNVIL